MRKKIITIVLIVALLSLSCVMLVGCGDRKVQVNGLVLKLYQEIDENKVEVPLDTQLIVGEKYKLEFACDIIAESSSDESASITIKLILPPVKIANALISDTNSGSSKIIDFNDADTGEIQREGSVIFKVPDDKGVAKNLHGSILLEPIMANNSTIKVNFSATNGIKLTGDSNDGYTKTIIIKNNKIATPEITYANEVIKWKHVKYADYYVVYVDGKELKDLDDKVVMVEVDRYTSAGSEISFSKLPEYIIGAHKVSIRGFNKNASYQISDYSNEITVEL